MVVADLVDPLLSKEDANRIFRVVLSRFRRAETGCGKLVVFDEAHKYLDTKMGDLCSDVVELVRMMRHRDIRVVVSTQNPSILDPELFELSSAVILHRISSPSWCVVKSCGSCAGRSPAPWLHLLQVTELSRLDTGSALLFCPQTSFAAGPHKDAVLGPFLYRVSIRKRLTADPALAKRRGKAAAVAEAHDGVDG
jgi:hypothetical protein